VFDLIETPYFQRLRRIKQLGLTHYVFPGATHTRFQHTIGALHLMSLALESLSGKGIRITAEEQEAACIAILLHDIGHGPFSHALEETIISGVNHEYLSNLYMDELNKQFSSKLDMAIAIFKNTYPKKFLHQLVTSQLDMDRLDYIKRDSFFTGVTEGTIGTDRLIKMLNVHEDKLVVEQKGIYSVEKFLISRRLMYWQVYYHKTVIGAENLLLKLLQRAKHLAIKKKEIYATPALAYFLYRRIQPQDIEKNIEEILHHFNLLDDNDIMVSAKQWQFDEDKVLSLLAEDLISRQLPLVTIQDKPFPVSELHEIRKKTSARYGIDLNDTGFLITEGEISNNAISGKDDMVQILMNDNTVKNVSEISDILNDPYMERQEKKYFLCYPRECKING